MNSCARLTSAAVLSLAIPWMASGAENHAGAGDPARAAQAVNALGLTLLAQGTAPGDNALLSPYSIQSALAMTYAGAAGATRDEMARVLHFTGDESALHSSFAGLQRALDELARRSAQRVARRTSGGAAGDPIALTVANRLYGQDGYAFRTPFLDLVKETYGAPFQPMDFVEHPAEAVTAINGWVEEQTRRRIRDLIPPDGIDRETRLVLVNAIYLKAPWADAFTEAATQPEPFHVRGGEGVAVPTMRSKEHYGYAHRDGFTAVTLPYSGGELQFLVLLPEASDGLAALEARLTPERLAECAQLPATEVILHLPKFKLEPPVFRLGKTLRSLGMKSAFDQPRGSADFDRMAPRRPDDYLCISEVFHKTFLALDEQGTEAAAATAVVMMRATSVAVREPEPVEVRVDRPFLFAIQHRATGAGLFLGRVTDPR